MAIYHSLARLELSGHGATGVKMNRSTVVHELAPTLSSLLHFQILCNALICDTSLDVSDALALANELAASCDTVEHGEGGAAKLTLSQFQWIQIFLFSNAQAEAINNSANDALRREKAVEEMNVWTCSALLMFAVVELG